MYLQDTFILFNFVVERDVFSELDFPTLLPDRFDAKMQSSLLARSSAICHTLGVHAGVKSSLSRRAITRTELLRASVLVSLTQIVSKTPLPQPQVCALHVHKRLPAFLHFQGHLHHSQSYKTSSGEQRTQM